MISPLVVTGDTWMENECSPPVLRVVLVEDYPGFQRYIRSALASSHDLELVAVAGDGLDGVERCIQLQPDVVLMDIGLPRLNGIEAARRIRAAVPQCRIIFLTQEHAPEILEEAFNLGATGYVLKTKAARDLFSALQAAREGGPFFCSEGLGGYSGSGQSREANAPGQESYTVPPRKPADHHEMHIYSDEPSFADGLASFIEGSLKQRKAVLALINEPHRDEVFRALAAMGVDVTAATEAGLLVPVYVGGFLSPLLRDGELNIADMTTAAQQLLDNLVRSNQGHGLNACGEVAPTLYAQGHCEAAAKVERLWDELAERYKFRLFCAYIAGDSPRDKDAFAQICAAHALVERH